VVALQLGLVVDAVSGDTAGEVEHRLLLWESGQYFDRSLDGGELAVRDENIKLGAGVRGGAIRRRKA